MRWAAGSEAADRYRPVLSAAEFSNPELRLMSIYDPDDADTSVETWGWKLVHEDFSPDQRCAVCMDLGGSLRDGGGMVHVPL